MLSALVYFYVLQNKKQNKSSISIGVHFSWVKNVLAYIHVLKFDLNNECTFLLGGVMEVNNCGYITSDKLY